MHSQVDGNHLNSYMHCSILLDYNFNKLEDIWFTSASHLTLATIELLMDRLPELLSIGECSCMGKLIYTIRQKTIISNLHFKFSHFTSFFSFSPPHFQLCVHCTGQLSGWDLTADDIFLLKGILKSSNSCLTLSPASFYP